MMSTGTCIYRSIGDDTGSDNLVIVEINRFQII
jgi:hypothetical protein